MTVFNLLILFLLFGLIAICIISLITPHHLLYTLKCMYKEDKLIEISNEQDIK